MEEDNLSDTQINEMFGFTPLRVVLIELDEIARELTEIGYSSSMVADIMARMIADTVNSRGLDDEEDDEYEDDDDEDDLENGSV